MNIFEVLLTQYMHSDAPEEWRARVHTRLPDGTTTFLYRRRYGTLRDACDMVSDLSRGLILWTESPDDWPEDD